MKIELKIRCQGVAVVDVPDDKVALISRCDDLNEFEELTGVLVGCWDMEHPQDCEIEELKCLPDSSDTPAEG
jgi:hypothetical protein